MTDADEVVELGCSMATNDSMLKDCCTDTGDDIDADDDEDTDKLARMRSSSGVNQALNSARCSDVHTARHDCRT